MIGNRNAAQKRVWRAEIVLLTADGLGTMEIMRRTEKSKTCVALAGALRRSGRQRPIARQERPPGGAADPGGDRPGGGADHDRAAA
jgi:hypothetical protein